MNRFRGIVAAALVVAFSSQAPALDLTGSAVFEYSDREGGTALNQNEANGRIRFTQAVLGFNEHFTGSHQAYVSLSVAGNAVRLSEAWWAFGGLPYQGTLSLGQFQKPGGAPLLTSNLTFPALMFHTPTVLGAKLAMERDVWNWELGLVDHNPLSAVGTTIAGSAGFSRPSAQAGLNSDNSRELYGHLGWFGGGEWGSLVLATTVTHGRFTAADRALVSGLGILDRNLRDVYRSTTRNTALVSADYTRGYWRVFGEYAYDQEGDLDIRTWNASLARRIGDLELVLGYDDLHNNAVNRPTNIPASWWRNRTSFSANYAITPSFSVSGIYEYNRENLTPGTVVTALRRPDNGIPNDGFILQATAGF